MSRKANTNGTGGTAAHDPELCGLPGPPLCPGYVADVFANHFVEEQVQGDRPVAVKVGLPANAIAQRLFDLTGGWPKRTGPLLFASEDNRPLYLENAPALFAWIGRQLPPVERNEILWIDSGADKVSRAVFLAHLQQVAEAFEAVEAFPHWPALPGHCYVHPPLAGGDGSAIRWLVGRFNASTMIDGDLILALFLSMVGGVRPGSRPAYLVTAQTDDE
jgi:hypothetical protein